MAAVKARKVKHKSLTPKHKKNKKYLQVYWPYIPLVVITLLIISVLQPWNSVLKRGVLPYATNVSVTGLLEATNKQRVNSGEPALELDTELTQAAQAKAYDMAAHDYWSHTTPDGSDPWVFISNAGYEYKKAGENLAYGFLSSDTVVSGWMNSPAHRDNVLDPAYSDVGFGFVNSPDFDGNGPATIVVAMYGDPANDTGVATAAAEGAGPPRAFSSLGNYGGQPVPTSISKIQAVTKGIAPWAQYAVGILIGATVMFLFIKHGLQLKRAFAKSERYALKHPLFDATLIALIILSMLVIQQVGVIL